MAQADLVVANQSGAAFRSDLNGQLLALGTLQSGASAPSVTYSYMFWADTTAGLLKIRDAANAAWVTVGTLGSTNLGLAPLASPTFTGTVTIPAGASISGFAPLASPTFTGTVAVPNLNGGPLAGMRNAIINGAMVVDQRNSGASVSSGVGVTTYTVDRWSVAATGAAVTVQRQGTAANYWLNITGAASNTIVNIRQRLEAVNIATLAGASVTLSFDCSSTTATSLVIAVSCASASDNFATVTNTQTFTRTITSTGTRYSASFTLPSQAVNGVEVLFSLTNFTSGTFALSDVQLEPGAVATPFERRSYGAELALCQRYYQTGNFKFWAYNAINEATGTTISFTNLMRTNPTVTTPGASGSNAGAVTIEQTYRNGFALFVPAVATGSLALSGPFIAVAEL